ncbi:MAG: hypothetical protein AAB675_03870 [Patescibacteria group bacterium]
MPEVDVPKKLDPAVSDWINSKINAGEGIFLGEDPEKLSRHRYEIDGKELSVDLNTECDIYRADLTEGHLQSLAAAGVIFEQGPVSEDGLIDIGNSIRQVCYPRVSGSGNFK